MPAKFKESVKILVDRQAKKYKTIHYYMHATSTAELQEAYSRAQTLPKHKQRIRNELVKRNAL
tara:strand:+ start:2773 stop:2961 length:189 start_codon:yes stop_codon:yes gene_type:complete